VNRNISSEASWDEESVAGLNATEHSQGKASALVTLLEYGDYECPACVQIEPLIRYLIHTYSENLRFVFRHFPLVEVHPHAEYAAEAAEAAAAQGQFWPMHHLLFSNLHHLEMEDLSRYAKSLGLGMNRFDGEMADRIYTQRVQEHRQAAKHSLVVTTPTFFLNDAKVDISLHSEKLDATIRAMLVC
jgi:protein-disulfide isomerase